MSTFHLHIRASDYTEFVCTVASEHCFPVQKTRSSFFFRLPAEKEGTCSWLWYVGGSRIGCRMHLLHKYLLFPAALVFSLSGGSEE